MTLFKRLLISLSIPVGRESEATWGIVILVSLLMPWSLPASHLFARFGMPRTFLSMSMVTVVWWSLLGLLSAVAQPK